MHTYIHTEVILRNQACTEGRRTRGLKKLRRQSDRRQFTNYIAMKVLDEVDGSTSDTFIPRALSRQLPISNLSASLHIQAGAYSY